MASQHSQYLKQEGEDIASIARGITNPKGRVHIGFGQQLDGDFADAEAVAADIDQQIAEQYQLFPSNIQAFEQLQLLSEKFSNLQEESVQRLSDWANQTKSHWMASDQAGFNKRSTEFKERVARYPEKLRQLVLEMYANPLINQHRELIE